MKQPKPINTHAKRKAGSRSNPKVDTNTDIRKFFIQPKPLGVTATEEEGARDLNGKGDNPSNSNSKSKNFKTNQQPTKHINTDKCKGSLDKQSNLTKSL